MTSMKSELPLYISTCLILMYKFTFLSLKLKYKNNYIDLHCGRTLSCIIYILFPVFKMYVPLCLVFENRPSWFIPLKLFAWDILWICFWRKVSQLFWWETSEQEKPSLYLTGLRSYQKMISFANIPFNITQHLVLWFRVWSFTTIFQLFLPIQFQKSLKPTSAFW